MHRFAVTLPDGRALPVQIISPPDYARETTWPVILTMHGGPNRRRSDAGAGAVHMADLYKKTATDAGWLVVAPAMIHVSVRGPRTNTRLAYEIMTATQMEALMNANGIFFDGNGLDVLCDWLLRDLTSAPQSYRLKVWRNGTSVEQPLDPALTPLR